MVMPKMNRIFTISASTETGVDSLIPWRYGQYGGASSPADIVAVGLPSVGVYAWNKNGMPIQFSDVDTAEKIVSYRDTGVDDLQLGVNSINADASPNAHLPLPGAVLRGVNLSGRRRVRIYPADGFPDQYVTFVARGRDEYIPDDPRFGEYFFIVIRPGTLRRVGDDFALDESDHIIITVESNQAGTSVSEPVEHRGVWGRLDERGATQTIQAAGAQLVSTAQQTATLTVRYRPDLIIGRSVIDDLGRDWAVESSRVIRDRRFIEYDLIRAIPVT